MGIAKRAGMKKATARLARKLAVIMHRMLTDGTPFTNQPAQRSRSNKGIGVWDRPAFGGRDIRLRSDVPTPKRKDRVTPVAIDGIDHALPDWPTCPLPTHQVAVSHRPRTENGPGERKKHRCRVL
jgi:hypothetical protein